MAVQVNTCSSFVNSIFEIFLCIDGLNAHVKYFNFYLGQGPTVLPAGAGGGCFFFFFLIPNNLTSFLSGSLYRRWLDVTKILSHRAVKSQTTNLIITLDVICLKYVSLSTFTYKQRASCEIEIFSV